MVDISKLYLNDIHKMASTFGIEAAVKVIVKVSSCNVLRKYFENLEKFLSFRK